MTDDSQQSDQTAMTILDDEHFDDTIRRVMHDDRLFLSVVDVVGALTGAPKPRMYWADMKRRIIDEGFRELLAKCQQLKMRSRDGKSYLTDAADIETVLRIVQSIPSPKAEPIKQWLARVGTERLQEMEDPSRAVERARKDYERLGYASEWIDRRLQGQVIRDERTHEWSERGASGPRDYASLTDTIHRGTFNVTVAKHKQIKGLKPSHNLRDHETVFELLLSGISEEVAKELHQQHDSQGYDELHEDAKQAGEVGGATRQDI